MLEHGRKEDKQRVLAAIYQSRFSAGAFSWFQDFHVPTQGIIQTIRANIADFSSLLAKNLRVFVICKSSMSKESFAEIQCKKLSTSIHGDESIRILVVAKKQGTDIFLCYVCMLQWGFTPFSLRREVFKQRGGEVLWNLYHWWTCWQWNHPTGRSSLFGFADVFQDSLYSLVPKFSPTAPTVQLWHLEHGSHGELLPSFLAPMIDRKGLPFWELF